MLQGMLKDKSEDDEMFDKHKSVEEHLSRQRALQHQDIRDKLGNSLMKVSEKSKVIKKDKKFPISA